MMMRIGRGCIVRSMEISYVPFLKDVYSVDVEILEENGDKNYVQLEMRDEKWVGYIQTDNNEVVYKFIVNGLVRINDSNATSYKVVNGEEVYSVMSDSAYTKEWPVMKEVVVSDRICGKMINCIKKKNLNFKDSMKVAVGLQVQNLKNVHSVTFIWHQPDGRIYRVEERALDVPDYAGVVSADVWFWINFCEINGEFSDGVWCIEAFVDGRRCAMDYFLVRRQLLKKPFRFELAI